MNDLKEQLTEASRRYQLDTTEGFERLRRKRDRKTRTERVESGAVALAVTALAVAILFKAFGSSGVVPADAPITNGELMYAKRIDNGWSLFAVDPSTGADRRLTHGYRDYSSDWSPDGSSIIFDSEDRRTEESRILIADAAGDNPRLFARIEARFPAWSSDGRIGYTDLNGHLVVVGTDGKAETPLGGMPDTFDIPADWSPDGTTLLIVREGPEGTSLWTWSTEQPVPRAIAELPLEMIGLPDWSPDGQRLLLSLFPEDGKVGGIATIQVDGTGLHIIPALENRGDRTLADAVWSPDGNQIAFVEDNRRIVVADTDGSNSRAIGIDPGDSSIEELAWGTHLAGAVPSPDSAEPSPQTATHPGAARLVLERMVDQERHIYLGDPEDGSLVELTRGSNDQGAIVSPDGTQIVYHGDRGLIVVNSDGSDKEVTSPRDHYYYPEAWSQDGTEILVTDYFGDNQDAFRWVNPVTRLVRDASFTSGGPADIAPDGRVAHVVLDVSSGALEYRLHIWDPATDQDHLVIDRDATSVAWSPDGSRIAFTSDFDIWLVNPDGTDAVQLTHVKDGRTASSPRWSPDGTRIAYEQNGAIWMMDSDGSNRHVVLGGPDGYGLSDWAVVSPAG